MICVEQGLYPPPELLYGLYLSWREYLSAGGEMSLEDALIGKSVQKAGNRAARWHLELRDVWVATAVWELVKSGMKLEDAAREFLRRHPVMKSHMTVLSPGTVVKIASKQQRVKRLVLGDRKK